MPCGVNAEQKRKIEEAKERTVALIGEAKLPADSPARANVDKVNQRWEDLITRLMDGPHAASGWRIYEAGEGIMMTNYDSFGDVGLTESSRLASGKPERFWLDKVTKAVWMPLIKEIVGISEEENRQFRDEYIASVT